VSNKKCNLPEIENKIILAETLLKLFTYFIRIRKILNEKNIGNYHLKIYCFKLPSRVKLSSFLIFSIFFL